MFFILKDCVSLRVPRRGVSTFAMLTGTLPFTVEPFNIKQLHQKMVNGEIGSIPSDVSKGRRNAFLTSCLHRLFELAGADVEISDQRKSQT